MCNQPSRRLTEPQQERRNHETGNAANQKHDLPAERRHNQRTNLAGHHQTNWKDHLVEQEESTASVGPRQLVDVNRGNRHLAADADALDEAEEQQHGEVPRERARDAHDGHQGRCARSAPHAPVSLGKRPEDERTGQLSEVADRNQPANLDGGDIPQPHEHRQDERDRERVERIEERGAAHDDTGAHMPPREGRALEPRDELSPGSRGVWRGRGLHRRCHVCCCRSWNTTSAIASGRSIGVRCLALGRTVNVEWGIASCNCWAIATGVA